MAVCWGKKDNRPFVVPRNLHGRRLSFRRYHTRQIPHPRVLRCQCGHHTNQRHASFSEENGRLHQNRRVGRLLAVVVLDGLGV